MHIMSFDACCIPISQLVLVRHGVTGISQIKLDICYVSPEGKNLHYFVSGSNTLMWYIKLLYYLLL